MAAISVCIIEGCDNPVRVKARGLCRAHYLRWYRNGDPQAGGKMHAASGEAIEFLNQVVMNHQGDDCLFWPYSRSRGAAMIYLDGQNGRVCRIVCERINGPAPTPEHEAAHSCGNDHLGCVSPHHIRWATGSENNQDKLLHGTHNRGERHSLAKLTEADVRAIRKLRGTLSRSDIADRFGVSVATIKSVFAGQTWGWLD